MNDGSNRCISRQDAATAAPCGHGAPQWRCRATDGDVVPRPHGDLVRRSDGRGRLGGDRTHLPASRRVVLRLSVVRLRGDRSRRQRRPRLHGRLRAHHGLRSRRPAVGVRAACHHRVPPRARRVESGAPSRRPRLDHRAPATSSSNSQAGQSSRQGWPRDRFRNLSGRHQRSQFRSWLGARFLVERGALALHHDCQHVVPRSRSRSGTSATTSERATGRPRNNSL